MIAPKYATMLKQIEGGRTVRQGDIGVVFTYQLQDGHGEPIENKTGVGAHVYLSNKRGYKVYETVAEVKEGGLVSFFINAYIPPTNYIVTIKVDGVSYPTNTNTRIRVTRGYDVVNHSIPMIPVAPSAGEGTSLSTTDLQNITKTTVEAYLNENLQTKVMSMNERIVLSWFLENENNGDWQRHLAGMMKRIMGLNKDIRSFNFNDISKLDDIAITRGKLFFKDGNTFKRVLEIDSPDTETDAYIQMTAGTQSNAGNLKKGIIDTLNSMTIEQMELAVKFMKLLKTGPVEEKQEWLSGSQETGGEVLMHKRIPTNAIYIDGPETDQHGSFIGDDSKTVFDIRSAGTHYIQN